MRYIFPLHRQVDQCIIVLNMNKVCLVYPKGMLRALLIKYLVHFITSPVIRNTRRLRNTLKVEECNGSKLGFWIVVIYLEPSLNNLVCSKFPYKSYTTLTQWSQNSIKINYSNLTNIVLLLERYPMPCNF